MHFSVSCHQGEILLFHELLLEIAPLPSCPTNPACLQVCQAPCPIPLPVNDSNRFPHLLSWALAGQRAQFGTLLRRKYFCGQYLSSHNVGSTLEISATDNCNTPIGKKRCCDCGSFIPASPFPEYMQAIFLVLPVGDK